MDQEAVLREPVLTKPCPHCGELLRLYIVRVPTDDRLPGFALAQPDRLPPTDAVLVWAQTGMAALNVVLDLTVVTHPTYICSRPEYHQAVAEQWPAASGTGGRP